jgi:translocation and assembly module TamB
MSPNVETGQGRNRRRLRTIVIGLTLIVLIVAATVAALPSLAGLAPIRGWIVSAANARLAPTRIELASLGLSWSGPVRMTGLVLRDARGKAIVTAPEATFDRNVRQLALGRGGPATLTLVGAKVDIERSADGSIDLLQALGPILSPTSKKLAKSEQSGESKTDFTLKVERGSLRLRSPELGEPLTAEQLDLTLRAPAAPRPLSWTVALANPSASGGEAMEIEGHYDHRAAAGSAPGLALNLTGHRWPVAPVLAGVVGRGRLDGPIAIKQAGGEWSLTGDARVLDLDAAGPALAGDRVKLDRVAGAWDLALVDGRWTIRKLDVSTPVGTVKASGTLADGSAATGRIDARLDLAALAKQAPHALHLRDGLSLDKGDVQLRAEVRDEPAGPVLDLEVRISDLNARDKGRAVALRDPATLSARLPLKAGRDGVGAGAGTVELKAAFCDLKGSGDLETGGKLAGTVDLGALQTQLRQLVDFGGLDFSGKARVAGSYRREPEKVTGQIAVEIQRPRFAGLTVRPIERDALRLDFAVLGPNAATGLAGSWQAAWLDVKSDDLVAKVEASRQDDDPAIALKASASGVLALSSLMGQAQGRLAGRWAGKALTIDEAHTAFQPGAGARNAALKLTASGRFDLAGGTLDLQPKTRPGDLLMVASEGLHLTGLGGAGGSVGVRGGLTGDLPALDRALAAWAGSAPSGFGGYATVRGSAKVDGSSGVVAFDARLESADFTSLNADGRTWTARGPVALASRGTYAVAADRLDFADLALSVPDGTVKAAGSLSEATGRRLADLQATASPSWDRLKILALGGLASEVLVSGEVRPFRVRGPLSGGSTWEMLRGLETELRVDLSAIRAFGLHTDPMPLVVRIAGRQIVIDPLSTAINGGRLELKPLVVLDDPKGPSLRLASGSEVRDVEIDDEVSRRVLAYCVPLLHNATQARGRLTAAFDRAEFPLAGDPNRSTSAAGRIVFKDVTYGPGTLGKELLTLTGRRQVATVRLNETVAFEVVNGRVHQSGLSIPVATDARVELAGSVGFDSTLRLRAGVPITKAMLGNLGLAGEVVEGTKIDVPIGGTLSHPTIERRALQVGLRDAGRALIRKEASKGVGDAIKRLPLPKGADGDAIRNELQNLFKPRPRKR